MSKQAEKTSIDIFFEYLTTADIVYVDNICQTNMNTRKHAYDIITDDVVAVDINPNHTFTVLFCNGERNVFEMRRTEPHFHPTDEVTLTTLGIGKELSEMLKPLTGAK